MTDVAGNLKKHTACLDKLKEKSCEGEASLQNALELTSQSLRSTYVSLCSVLATSITYEAC